MYEKLQKQTADHKDCKQTTGGYSENEMADTRKSTFQDLTHDSGLGSLPRLGSNFYQSEDPEDVSLLESSFLKMQIDQECQPRCHDSGVFISGQYNSYSSSHIGSDQMPCPVLSAVHEIVDNSRANTARDKGVNFHITMEQVIQLYEGDKDGDNKLHLSIINGHSECAHLLINLVPDVEWLNYSNFLQQTPLHLAVLTRQPNIVRHLICVGAVTSIQDKQGDTPLHIACMLGYEECVKYLLNPAQNQDSLKNMCNTPQRGLVQELAVRNFQGETCLHLAANFGHHNIVQILLEAGADINMGDGRSGRSVLHVAADRGDSDLVKVLLSCSRVNVHKQDYAGLTPAQVAWGRNNSNMIKIFFFANHGDEEISINDDMCECSISQSVCKCSISR